MRRGRVGPGGRVGARHGLVVACGWAGAYPVIVEVLDAWSTQSVPGPPAEWIGGETGELDVVFVPVLSGWRGRIGGCHENLRADGQPANPHLAIEPPDMGHPSVVSRGDVGHPPVPSPPS
jgi:hypothetical protein